MQLFSWLSDKESTCQCRRRGFKSPREGNGNPLQYSGPGNFMDRGALWVTVHGVARVRHDLVTEQQQQYSTMNVIDKRTMYTRDTQLLLLV